MRSVMKDAVALQMRSSRNLSRNLGDCGVSGQYVEVNMAFMCYLVQI